MKKLHPFYLRGKDSINYKHGNARGGYGVMDNRKVAISVYGKKCNSCKCTDKKLHLHHIDKNWKNNDISNWELLCPYCHRQKHRKYKSKEQYKIEFAQKRSIVSRFTLNANEYTLKNVIVKLGITKQRIHQLIKSKKILPILKKGKKYNKYIFTDDIVEKYIKENRMEKENKKKYRSIGLKLDEKLWDELILFKNKLEAEKKRFVSITTIISDALVIYFKEGVK